MFCVVGNKRLCNYFPDQGNSTSQCLEGSEMNAHHGCWELHITQNSALTSDGLIIQNDEFKKEESPCLYNISNPTDTSRTIQTEEPYQGNVNFVHFKKL